MPRRFAASFLLLACACAPRAEGRSDPVVAPAALEEPPQARACPEQPGLCFFVVPADAAIEVDGELAPGSGVDTVSSPWFLDRPAGIYQITLRKEGFRTWRGEVSVREGPERIEVTLSPVVDAGAP